MTKPPTNTEERRDALRLRLIDIVERRIAEQGLDAIKARDVAREAGCALGAIYNVVADMNELVMAVNGRTFKRLGRFVSQSLQGRSDAPQDQLVAMSHAYLHFAAENTQSWRALFDLEMSTESRVPDWYVAELAGLFAIIADPLRRLFPDWTATQIDLMTRALFSSVHGMVLLGLEKRISGVPIPRIEEMITVLLSAVPGASPPNTVTESNPR